MKRHQIVRVLTALLICHRSAGVTIWTNSRTRASSSIARGQREHQLLVDVKQQLLKCGDDPKSCSDVVDQTSNYSQQMKDRIIDDQNKTEEELRNMTLEIQKCTLDQNSQFLTNFDTAVTQHTACREKQALMDVSVTTAEALVSSSRTVLDAQCQNPVLTQPVGNLVDICKPSAQQPLGQWLASMQATFAQKHGAWSAQQLKCDQARWAHGNATLKLNDTRTNLSDTASVCERNLASVETIACSHATLTQSSCTSYTTCYNGVKQRYDAKVSGIDELTKKWRQSWVAAEKLSCMKNAMGTTGVVNKAKMSRCQNITTANASHINVTIPSLPPKQGCSIPDVFGGSATFRSMVYSVLPAGVQVRDPHLCLAWQGGCAVRSNFPTKFVHLYSGTPKSYCSSDDKGDVVCNKNSSFAGKFVFKQVNPTNCTGATTLYYWDGSAERACVIDPSSSAFLKVKCPSSAQPVVLDLMKNPLATGRSGHVTFESPGPLVADALKTAVSYKGNMLNTWIGVRNAAGNGVVSGFFTSWSTSIASCSSNRQCDRSMAFAAKFPSSAFGEFSGSQWSTFTSNHESWVRPCPTGKVMTAVESRWTGMNQNTQIDRIFRMRCSTPPAGLVVGAGEWSTEWANLVDPPKPLRFYGFPRKDAFRCPEGTVMTGMQSQHFARKKNQRYYPDRQFKFACAALRSQSAVVNVDVEYAIQNA